MDLKVIDTIGSWKRHKKIYCALIQRPIAHGCYINSWKKYVVEEVRKLFTPKGDET